MPRNISFALTTGQIRNQTKTVTRRLGWWKDKNGRQLLKAGDVLNACVKCMGLKPGESIERICQIKVVRVGREPLESMATCVAGPDSEAGKEGFPEMTGADFVEMFCQHMGCKPGCEVTRIEFEYVDGGEG